MVRIVLQCFDGSSRTVSIAVCRRVWERRMWSEEKKIHREDIYAANSGTYIDTGIISIFHVSI